jgi:two-component system nitrate/nitrite response regulator NarL
LTYVKRPAGYRIKLDLNNSNRIQMKAIEGGNVVDERVGTPLAMARALRVLVIERQTAERRRLVDALARETGVDVVGETADPEHAVTLAAAILPDVVLLSANLEGTSHGEIVTKLRAAAPKAHVLVLTHAEEGDALADALRAGASGYLVRNLDGGFMVDTLRSTVEHGGPFRFRATAIGCPSLPASPLSRRERQTLTLVAEGWTNKQIARELGVAESTVKVHVQHILRKLKLESRVQAAVYAAENGLALKH